MTSKIIVNTIEADTGISSVTFASNINLQNDSSILVSSSGVTLGTGSTIAAPSANEITLSTNSAERVRIDSSGNVGIGTDNPIAKLNVHSGTTNLAAQIVSDDAEVFLAFKDGDSSGNQQVQIGGVGNNFVAYAGGNERLRITSGGNIGVAGVTGTDYSLLDGMVINTANGSAGLLINSSSSSHNAYLGFSYGSGSSTSHADQYSAYIGRVGDNKLILGTNNTIRLNIDSSGRVGIQGDPTRALLEVRASGGSNTMLTALWGANEGTTTGALSDNTDKAVRMGIQHYDTDALPYAFLVGSSTSSANNLTFGGGTSLMNAATEIVFRTASNTTTTAGTERLRVTSTGQLLLGINNAVASDVNFQIHGASSGVGPILNMTNDTGDCRIFFGQDNSSGGANAQGQIRYNVANNYLAAYSGGAERLRIDSAGRMGLGANNPGDYDNEANDFVVRSANHTGITIASSGSNQRCNLYFSDGTSGSQKYRGAFTYDHNDDSLMVRTAGVERLRIASNGSATFDKGAPGGSNQVIARFQAESSRILDLVWHDSGSRMGFDTPGSHHYTFKISNTEYLRLRHTHGSGNAFGPLLEGVNGTGAFFNGGTSNKESDSTVAITKQNNNDWGLMVRNYEGSSTDYGFYSRSKNSAAYAIAVFDHDNSAWRFRVNGAGGIFATNTTVSSISDQRLKENIVDANSQWDDIKALRFRNFNWKEDSGLSDGRTYLGLIAQEVEPISPNLVDINAQSKEDIENEVPDPEYKNVKYSIVWMKAVKALQEAQTRIETLETQLTDALARITDLEGS